jgi:ribosomal protein L9
MPSGNGARAQQKRERNQKKQSQQKTAKSQLKSNQAALTIQCKVCKQSFMCVSSQEVLRRHAENRHPKLEFSQCFDGMLDSFSFCDKAFRFC